MKVALWNIAGDMRNMCILTSNKSIKDVKQDLNSLDPLQCDRLIRCNMLIAVVRVARACDFCIRYQNLVIEVFVLGSVTI